MNRLFIVFALLLSPVFAFAELASAEEAVVFETEAAALERAKQLGCEGAYAWEGMWLPCKEDDEGEDHGGHNHAAHDHSGHDH